MEQKLDDNSSKLLERLKMIGDHFKDCFTIVDMDDPRRRCLYVNAVFTDVTGFKPEDAIGSNLDFLQGPESSAAAVDFMRHCFRSELACCQDIVNYRKDGSAFVNRLVMLPFKQQHLYYLGFQNDVTDQYDKGADKIDLSDIIHGEICHVLNNTLGSILLALDLALERGDNSDSSMREVGQLFERINLFCRGEEDSQGFMGHNPFRPS